MTKGYLLSKGFHVAENRVGDSLKGSVQRDTKQEEITVDRVNPMRYKATHFGHKLHLDQNEKLNMYGVTCLE